MFSSFGLFSFSVCSLWWTGFVGLALPLDFLAGWCFFDGLALPEPDPEPPEPEPPDGLEPDPEPPLGLEPLLGLAPLFFDGFPPLFG